MTGNWVDATPRGKLCQRIAELEAERDAAWRALGHEPHPKVFESSKTYPPFDDTLEGEIRRVVWATKSEKDALRSERDTMKSALDQIDDVLVVHWVAPPKDGDYRRALNELVQQNIKEHEYFGDEKLREAVRVLAGALERDEDCCARAWANREAHDRCCDECKAARQALEHPAVKEVLK